MANEFDEASKHAREGMNEASPHDEKLDATPALDEAEDQLLSTAEYLARAGQVCPRCGSDQIEGGGGMEVDGTTVVNHMGCLECDFGWRDVYSLHRYVQE
jgi:hypothetical protein